ncbi:MAG: hypothetical protein ACXVCG_14060, partial [Bdellovibrionota bacterium]
AEIELKEIPALIKERDNAINEKKEEQLEKSRQREEKRAAELKAREESYKSLPPDEADRQRKLDAQIDDGDQEDQACFQDPDPIQAKFLAIPEEPSPETPVKLLP